jgi:hypothetical protein
VIRLCRCHQRKIVSASSVAPSSAILMTVLAWPLVIPTQILLAGSEWACPMNLIDIAMRVVACAAECGVSFATYCEPDPNRQGTKQVLERFDQRGRPRRVL